MLFWTKDCSVYDAVLNFIKVNHSCYDYKAYNNINSFRIQISNYYMQYSTIHRTARPIEMCKSRARYFIYSKQKL